MVKYKYSEISKTLKDADNATGDYSYFNKR